jgi:hypothetical protein
MDDSDVAGTPGGDGEVNEMHLEEGKLVASSTCSIACWNGDEEWLERRQRPCDFGRR